VKSIEWAAVARFGGGMKGRARATRVLCALAVAAGTALTLVPVASATVSPFTWAGSSSKPNWSVAANWEGGSAPSSSEPIDLEFPRIPDCTGTCYESKNDLSGLTAESIKLDDGDEYTLSGEEITLGGGGLTASPASGSNGPSGDVLELPIKLGASQTWSIAGRNEGGLGENGAAVFGKLTGSSSSALTFEISNEAGLFLENETEVGPAAISGADTSEAGVLNGFVAFFGELNFSNGSPVSVNHIFLIGSGAFGALSTNHAELDVGRGEDPAEGIAADSATFDSDSEIGFQIAGAGSAAGQDYSQLISTGPVELGGSTMIAQVLEPEVGSCPSLHPGQTYTFVSTTGELSGTFANAPEGGPEIPISFAKSCDLSPRSMQIVYHRSGVTETVTGTVEAKAKEEQEAHEHDEAQEREARERREALERQEAQAHLEAKERQETKQREEAAEMQKLEKEAAAAVKKRQEEETAAAAAKKRQEEETAAKGGVLGVKEESKPKPPTRAQLLAKSLKTCRRQSRKRRARCEASARKKYGSKKGKKK
jgi:hypothetical protein